MAGSGTSQEAMAAGAALVNEATEQARGQVNTLRTEVETMRGGWGGEASNAFGALLQDFETQASRIDDALRAMYEALGGARATYAAQEEQETSNITRTTGQIDEARGGTP